MHKQQFVKSVIGDRQEPQTIQASAYAPANIALIKYWGKRNTELNLPVTSSLSISLANKGTTTTLKATSEGQDKIILNQQVLDLSHPFVTRLHNFLNLFRLPQHSFTITTESSIPIASGLASSASGFAALTLALNQLYGWNLTAPQLSLLARLGSGSACRSLWHGFVEWQCGDQDDGLDSYGSLLEIEWPELCIGLMIFDEQEKAISSRQAMLQTVTTSLFYKTWPQIVKNDLEQIRPALAAQDLHSMGKIAEANAIAMHATMLTARPSICYHQAKTMELMHRVWQLRAQGLAVYFTQDAGPNLKLIFEKHLASEIQKLFPGCEIVEPFYAKSNLIANV